MKLTPAQTRAFQNGCQKMQAIEADLVKLRALADQFPDYADRVKELEELRDHTAQLCAAGVALSE